jgi:hypothetical protein
MKTMKRNRYTAPSHFTLAVDGGFSSFTSREKAKGTHWIRRWVGPRKGLDAEEKRENVFPFREQNPARLVRIRRFTD